MISNYKVFIDKEDGEYYSFSKENGLLKLTVGMQNIDDNTYPEFGLIGNYASVEINDSNCFLEGLALDNFFDNQRYVIIEIYDENDKYKGNLGKFFCSNFKKNGNTAIIYLEDVIVKAQEINVEKHFFGNVDTIQVFGYLLGILYDKLKINCNEDTYTILEEKLYGRETPNNFVMESGKLWDKLDKWAKANLLRLHMNYNFELTGECYLL